jgi:hypothetical protein
MELGAKYRKVTTGADEGVIHVPPLTISPGAHTVRVAD